MSRSGDYCMDNNNNNDKTDCSTPCAYAQSNKVLGVVTVVRGACHSEHVQNVQNASYSEPSNQMC